MNFGNLGIGFGALGGTGITGGGAGVTTTMDPANKHASITLSNGNLTATGTTTADVSAYSTASHLSGKFYVEVTATTVTRGFVGIQKTSEPVGNFPGINGNGISCVNDGTQFVVNGFPSVGATTVFTNGAVVSLAVDLDAKLIWQRVGAGNWNASGTANPATGVGGVTISAVGPFWFALVAGNTATSLTVNFGATAFTQTPPVGFGTW